MLRYLNTVPKFTDSPPRVSAAQHTAEFQKSVAAQGISLRTHFCRESFFEDPRPPEHLLTASKVLRKTNFVSQSSLSPDSYAYGVQCFDKCRISKSEFSYWQQKLGGFDLDAFASDEHHVVPDYGSKARPFSALDLRGRRVWAFPPRRYATRACLALLDTALHYPQSSGLILVPVDPLSSWWCLRQRFVIMHHFK